MFNANTPAYRAEMLKKWYAATLNGRGSVESDAHQIIKFKDSHYMPVRLATGVPWWVVGCIDCREEAFRHDRHLVNGDPLSSPTSHVPVGVGPFENWFDGAAFAMKHSGMRARPDVISYLIDLEKYNGEGYHGHPNPEAPASPCPSPYLWSGTNIYTKGKFGSDGKFDPALIDLQSGCVALVKCLINLGEDLGCPLSDLTFPLVEAAPV